MRMKLFNFIAKILGFKNRGGHGTGHGYVLSYEYDNRDGSSITKEIRWRIYNLSFRLFGRFGFWKKLGQMIWK